MFARLKNIFRKKTTDTYIDISDIPDVVDCNNLADTTDKKINKSQIEKKCGYCRNVGHNVSNCQSIIQEFEKITYYFSIPENLVSENIIKTRNFLLGFDNFILSRYLTKYKIFNYMYYECSKYFDNASGNKNIELLVGYFCVLPFHPEIRIKRVRTRNIPNHPKTPSKISFPQKFNVGFILNPLNPVLL